MEKNKQSKDRKLATMIKRVTVQWLEKQSQQQQPLLLRRDYGSVEKESKDNIEE